MSDQKFKSSVKYIRISPSKLRLTADIVRNKSLDVALSLLGASEKKGRLFIFQALKSALASIKEFKKENMPTFNKIFVSSIYVSEGPKLKRFMPRAMGRATGIIHRYSHLVVYLDCK